MSKALSVDLRVRVLAAVACGVTHWQAAERFGVSAASVSRWRAREREQGDARPKASGGDRRSGRIAAHEVTILSALEETLDITIEELRQALGEKGLAFGFGTIRRFFARQLVTLAEAPKRGDARLRSRLCQPRLQLRLGDVGHIDEKSADEGAVLLGTPRQPIAALRLRARVAP